MVNCFRFGLKPGPSPREKGGRCLRYRAGVVHFFESISGFGKKIFFGGFLVVLILMC